MKSFILVALLLSTSAFAKFPLVQIENFRGAYSESQGKAYADKFKAPEVDFGNGAVIFEVFKQAGNYVMRADGKEYVWENPPMELDQVDSLNWNGISVISDGKNFNVQVDKMEGKGQQDYVLMEGLKVNCQFEASQAQNEAEDMMHSCINNSGSITVRRMSQNKAFTKNAMVMGQAITNINFKNNKNRFTFSLASGLSIHGNGMAWYVPAEKLVKIRIDTAKWKFMNVKSRLFGELKQMENEQVKVNNPWIIINLEE